MKQHPLTYVKKHPGKAAKTAGIGLVLLILLLAALKLAVSTVDGLFSGGNYLSLPGSMPGVSQSATKEMHYGEGDMAMEDSAARGMALNTSMPSPIPPRDGYIGGDDAEEYEVTEYNGYIETSDTDETCKVLEDLVALDYVVAQNRQNFDRGCSYNFKVPSDQAAQVLAQIEELDPEELTVNTYTIKRSIEYVTNEREILEQKLETIDETLENALEAYDDITAIATRSNDAEALASVIDSKLRMIERLTQERLNIVERLRRLEKQASDQQDQLNYVNFYINVQYDALLDTKNIKESWKQAVKEVVRDVNEIVQDLSVGLLVLALTIAQFALYFFIALIVAKIGWKVAKRIWNN